VGLVDVEGQGVKISNAQREAVERAASHLEQVRGFPGFIIYG
jgi:hypothetical protein